MIFRVDHLGQFRFDVGFSEPGQGLGGLGQVLPDVVMWDPTLLTQPEHPVLWQRGCPPGYFTEFVPPGSGGGQPYPLSMVTGNPTDRQLSQGTWVRCRLAATTTPETLQAETGLSAQETASIFTGAMRDTIQQIPQNLRGVVEEVGSLLKWGIAGLLAVAAIAWRPRGK